MFRTLLLPCLLAMLIFSSSCKKEKETTQSKIQHKWTINSYKENDKVGGQDDVSTTPGEPGDYIEFNAGNTATLNSEGTLETSSYSITAEDKLLLGLQTFDIRTLNSNTLVLYTKETEDADNYYELTINLSR